MEPASISKRNAEIKNARDRALIGALVGAGGCVPALMALSEFALLTSIEVAGVLTSGAALGCSIALATARTKATGIEPEKLEAQSSLVPLRPASELVFRHDERGDVLEHSGSNHYELGKIADTLFGGGLLNRIRISDRPAYLKAISDAQHGKATKCVRLNVAVSNMSQFHKPFSFKAWPTPNGCESSLSDIVAQVDLERTIENLHSADEAEDKIANIASHMAHELRSPLNSILGFSDMLSGETADRFTEAQCKEYAGLIHQSGEHLLSVVDNMLDIGQLKAGRFELSENLFDVGLLCHESIAILEPQIQESALEIEVDYPHDLPQLFADEKCCRQILINLLGNAIKFTSGAGTVSLTVRQVRTHMEFVVKDNGVGIPDEALARLGQPFERVKGTDVPGTGLGLSLVRKMVELHGGTFKLDSILGEGTTATMALPIVRVQSREAFSKKRAHDADDLDRISSSEPDNQRRIA
ncbi:MAG: HAMP domain-containing sensor histidine kinase [Hyphomicrobiales bacterium]